MAYETMLFAPVFVSFLVVVSVWEAVWKAIALWKSARNSQLAWFIVMAIFNTAGILPIVYIMFFQKKRQITVSKKKK